MQIKREKARARRTRLYPPSLHRYYKRQKRARDFKGDSLPKEVNLSYTKGNNRGLR